MLRPHAPSGITWQVWGQNDVEKQEYFCLPRVQHVALSRCTLATRGTNSSLVMHAFRSIAASILILEKISLLGFITAVIMYVKLSPGERHEPLFSITVKRVISLASSLARAVALPGRSGREDPGGS
jgi:hypothetical protein